MLETIKTKVLEAYNSMDTAEKIVSVLCLITMLVVVIFSRLDYVEYIR